MAHLEPCISMPGCFYRHSEAAVPALLSLVCLHWLYIASFDLTKHICLLSKNDLGLSTLGAALVLSVWLHLFENPFPERAWSVGRANLGIAVLHLHGCLLYDINQRVR